MTLLRYYILIFLLGIFVLGSSVVLAEGKKDVRGGFFEQNRAKSGLFDPNKTAISYGTKKKPRMESGGQSDSFAIPVTPDRSNPEPEETPVSEEPEKSEQPLVSQPDPDPLPSDSVPQVPSRDMREQVNNMMKDPAMRQDFESTLEASAELKKKLEFIKGKSTNPDGSFSVEKFQKTLEDLEDVLEPKQPEKKKESYRF